MSRSLGVVLGFAADRAFGDPQRFHPVAGFGQLAGALERRLYDDARGRGVLHAGILVGGAAGLGLLAEWTLRDRPVLHTLATGAATWAVLGGTSLNQEAHAVEARLGDLPAARQRLTHLVGRDTTELDEPAIVRAVVESVAENSSDAVVAPLLWGGVAGLPGLMGYRAANTLDAMVGHRSSRYERFGWASARFDDLLNLAPARLAALLAAAGSDAPGAALSAWRRDARGHPSPNAGPVEAAFAGGLGIRLGGVNLYQGAVEDRHVLGDGRAPRREDIARATRLADRVGLGALAVSVLAARAARRRRRRRR